MSQEKSDYNPLTLTEKELLFKWAETVSNFSHLGDLVLRLLDENERLYIRTFALSMIPQEAIEVMIEAAMESEGFKWN